MRRLILSLVVAGSAVMAQEMKPRPPLEALDAPQQAPASLRAWLLGEAAAKIVRVPVLVKQSSLGLSDAVITWTPTPKDRLAVTLDDSRLGISLADRVRWTCPKADTCHLWLEGTARAAEKDALIFEVREVGERVHVPM